MEESSIPSASFRAVPDGITPVYFAQDEKMLGVISIEDSILPTAAEEVTLLKSLDIRTVMLTGDCTVSASRFGEITGIDEVHSRLFPAGKEAIIRDLQKGGDVLMAGNGTNDAQALMHADVRGRGRGWF